MLAAVDYGPTAKPALTGEEMTRPRQANGGVSCFLGRVCYTFVKHNVTRTVIARSYSRPGRGRAPHYHHTPKPVPPVQRWRYL
jgi:hypothetical protein